MQTRLGYVDSLFTRRDETSVKSDIADSNLIVENPGWVGAL